MERRRRWLSWLGVVAACASVTAALAFYKFDQIRAAQARAAAFPEPMAAVESVLAVRSERETSLQLTGELVPRRSAALRTELAGRISAVNVAPGAAVSAGAVLLQLDVSQERAELAETVAREQLASLAFDRAERLVQRGAGSAEARDQARAERDAAAARSRALRAAIAKKTITAPFSGTAGLHRLEAGQYLNAGDVITQLVSTERVLWLDFSVPQQYAEIAVGTQIEVTSDAARLPAQIIARDPAVSASSRNLRVRAELDATGTPLMAGMFVEASVPLGNTRTVTLVPAAAVRRDALGTSVYVLEDRDGEVRARKQGVALLNDGDVSGNQDLVVIERGLQGGERIAANGAFKLRDGSLVNPVQAPQGAAERLVGH